MRNRRPERRFVLRALAIQMNPLPVFGCFRKLIDPLLRNNYPFARANFLPNVLLQRFRCFNCENRHPYLPLRNGVAFHEVMEARQIWSEAIGKEKRQHIRCAQCKQGCRTPHGFISIFCETLQDLSKITARWIAPWACSTCQAPIWRSIRYALHPDRRPAAACERWPMSWRETCPAKRPPRHA